MPHLDDGVLHALADGEVPASALAPIRAHLEACADCRRRLDEARALAEDARALVESIEVPTAGPASERPARRLRIRRHPGRALALAASLTLAVALGYAGRGWVNGLDMPAPAAERAAQDLTSASPSTAATAETPDPAVQSLPEPRPPSPRPADQPAPEERLADAAAGARARGDVALRPVAPSPGEARSAQTTNRPDRADAPRPESAAAPVPATLAQPTILQRASAERDAPARLEAAGAAAKSAAAPVQPATLPVAAALVGGRLRMIEGMVPVRLEVAGSRVRVVYLVGGGELILEQWREADTVAVRLTGPLRADSLAALLRRIR